MQSSTVYYFWKLRTNRAKKRRKKWVLCHVASRMSTQARWRSKVDVKLITSLEGQQFCIKTRFKIMLPISCRFELKRSMMTGKRTPKLKIRPMFPAWQTKAQAHTRYDQPLSCWRLGRFGSLWLKQIIFRCITLKRITWVFYAREYWINWGKLVRRCVLFQL